ncbi:MAG: acyl--CoA ligase [Planctomycetaceae bacterium]|nr:acyl--CoA ligase [Planctomycetaceae bacterium]
MTSNDILYASGKPDNFLASLENYKGQITCMDIQMTVSSDQLREGWSMLIRRFSESGMIPGDRIVVAVGNGPGFIAVWGAILALGGSPVPVHFETPPMELHRIACKFHASFIVTDSHTETEMELAESHSCTLECSNWGQIVWTDVYSGGRSPGDDRILDFAGIPLHPTSGTTGEPKLAVRPVRTAIAEIDNYVNTFGIDSGDTILGMTPMSHAFAHGFCVLAPVMTGANLVTMRKFQPKLVNQACSGMKITIIAAVAGVLDTMLFMGADVLKNPARKIFSGGGPLTERTAKQFKRITGIVPRPLYGTTETGGIAVARKDELCIDGCVGSPFNGVSVRFVPHAGEEEKNNSASCGKTGKESDIKPMSLVYVKSESLMSGYLVNETIDMGSLDSGWYNTGDLGYSDSCGRLYLHGREAEVINISGLKVLPREVEEILLSLKGIREIKVFGHKNRSGSCQLYAAVVADGLSVEDVRIYCRQQLVYYKQPSRIILLPELPKNAGGKVRLSELAGLVQGEIS